MKRTAGAATVMAVVSTLGIGTALCSQAPIPTTLAAGQVVTVADVSPASPLPGLDSRALRSFPASGAPTSALFASEPSRLVTLRTIAAARPALQLPLARPMPVVAPVLVPLAVTTPAPALLPAQITAPPRGDQGVLRVAHLSPSTGDVDMYVSGPGLPSTKVASDVGYRAVSGYLTASPGVYTLRPARPVPTPPRRPPSPRTSRWACGRPRPRPSPTSAPARPCRPRSSTTARSPPPPARATCAWCRPPRTSDP